MTDQNSSDKLAQSLRRLPSVHDLLATEPLIEAGKQFGRDRTREAARHTLEQKREQLQIGEASEIDSNIEQLAVEVVSLLDERKQLEMRRVINATGIVLHTGLGRAPLAKAAIEAVNQAAGYCNLELDLLTGERSQRVNSVESDLCALTGAESAHVVNNNAGATGLVLAALALGREVIVSHSELIEIGGGFRLPQVFQAYGARLRAVGTTNRTRIEDFVAAMSGETGAVMVIHPSNYRVVGFTQSTALEDLVALGKSRNVPVIHDIGSGALVEIAGETWDSDPIARESIRKGADLVLFSGDKLLGGPQCGVIVGKHALVSRLTSHPMSRALRIDKLSLAALQATLAIYRRGISDPRELDAIPLLNLVQTPISELRDRAMKLAKRLTAIDSDWETTALESVSYVGGGSLPGSELPSWAIAISHSDIDPGVLAQELRIARPSVVGRVQEGSLLLDLRTVSPDEDERMYDSVVRTFADRN